MPHPTPYSRQFDAIRSTYPRLFERPGDSVCPGHTDSSKATTDDRGEFAGKPDGK
jgi:hypothetical protein